MLATSAMNGAVIDSIFNTFFRLKISHAYDAVLSTPLDVTDVALGEVWWALARATIYAASFIVCMALLGDAASPWVVLCWPAAILTSFRLQLRGLAACTYIRSWQHFDLVSLIQLPLFLFSATFFPITLYPRGSARSSPSLRSTRQPRCCAASTLDSSSGSCSCGWAICWRSPWLG